MVDEGMVQPIQSRRGKRIEGVVNTLLTEPWMDASDDTLAFATTPIVKARLAHKADVSFKANLDRIKRVINCSICPGLYTSKNKSRHYRSRKHMLHAELNRKLKEFILRDKPLETILHELKINK